MVIVFRKFKAPSIDNSPSIYPSSHFYLFLEPTLLAIFFANIAIPICPFVQPPFDIPLFTESFISLPL